jgi:hypothetical protein
MTLYTTESLDVFRLNDPRKLYLNLADLYYRPWDPLTELIQNSLASLLERQAADKSFRGEISVTVDAAAKRLTVKDDGVGFRSLEDLAANRTTRDINNKSPHSGFGLGLSSVLARSDYFSVRTVNTKGELHEAVWTDTYNKLRSGGPLSELPPQSCDGPRSINEKSNTVIVAGGDAGFNELWQLAAKKPTELKEILLAHSALGHTSHIWQPTRKLNSQYRLIIKGGVDSVNEKERIGFPAVEIGSTGTFNFDEYDRHRKLPSDDELIIYKRMGRKSLTRPYRLNLYIACEVERGKHIPQKFGKYLEGLATNRILLSVNGFLQSFPIERPAERMTRALWGNIFAIVDSSDNIVEPGRNRIADLYIRTINEQLIDAIKRLDKLVSDVRDREKYSKPIDVDDAKKDAQVNAVSKPLNYSVKAKLHMLKEPEDEQEVIGLFCELLGHDLIDGCDVLRIGSGQHVYDAYLRFSFKWENVGIKVRPKKDEGKRTLDQQKQREKVLATEFKSTAPKLILELETGKTRKKLDQVDLLICWKEGTIPQGYDLDLLDDDHRFFPASTHVLKKTGDTSGASCEVVVLSDFLEKLEMEIAS